MRILILGGYGTFGGRLAELLVNEIRLSLLIGGRSIERAQAFCDRLAPGASRTAVRFDRDGDVQAQLQALLPDLVVDATGPFQCYGNDPYRVVRACLVQRVDYLDLADGADFVKGVAQFDGEARELGVFILSGVSSFPVLSAAVVRHLARDLATVDSITGGIAPSPYAGVGVNVIRAIASYSGKRLALIRDGNPSFGVAMTESLRYTIAPPGHLPLCNTRFSLVDVPDLQVLPELWPGLESVWMGAGPVPEILHRMLNTLAWLVRLHVLSSLLPLSPLIHLVSNRVRWGEHRGGMFIVITGTDALGGAATRSWHLLAQGDDGPLIPSMACQAIVRRGIAGRRPAAGARAATGDLELTDYEELFSGRSIYTGTRTSGSSDHNQPLYRRILGDAWHALPESLQRMHGCVGPQVAEGEADVERGRHPVARLVARAVGFPAAGRKIPVRVTFTPVAGEETWTRTFNGRSFTSVQAEGRARSAHLLTERFGPLSFDLALVIAGARLRLMVRRWSLWGVPLPRCLAPQGESYEEAIDGRFHFHVEIRQPLIGLIVRYRGWLRPESLGVISCPRTGLPLVPHDLV